MEVTFDPNQVFNIELSNATLNLELIVTSFISASLAFFAIVFSSRIAAQAARENTRAILSEMNMRLGSERISLAQQSILNFSTSAERLNTGDRQALELLKLEAQKVEMAVNLMDLEDSSHDHVLPENPNRTAISDWSKDLIEGSTLRVGAYAKNLADRNRDTVDG